MSLASYLLDAAGFGLVPSAVLVAALMFASAVAWSQLRQGADRQGAGRYGDVLAWAGVVGAVTAWLLHGTDGFRAFYSVIAVGAALPLIVTGPESLEMQYRSWYAIETRDVAPMPRYGTGGADLYAGLMGQFRVWFGVDWPHWPVAYLYRATRWHWPN